MADDFIFVDYDTIFHNGERKRIQGIDAPEVWNWSQNGVSLAEPGGTEAASKAANLAQAGGFLNILDLDEKDARNRPLIRLINSKGDDFSDKTYLEGVISTGDYSDSRAKQMYLEGETQRLINKARGVQENEEDPWVQARNSRYESDRANFEMIENNGVQLMKPRALNEAQWKENEDALGSGFNIYRKGDVKYHTPGARYDNSAISPMSTGWDSAVLSMKEGIEGFKASMSDVLDDEGAWTLAEERVLALQSEQQELPTFINNYGDVDSLKDAGEYTAGLMGQMAPYLLGIMGSSAAAALLVPASAGAAVTFAAGALPMSLIYAGQTYAEMEGDITEKSAGLALAGGVIMSSLDRLGLKGLMSATDFFKRDSMKRMTLAYMEEQKKVGNKLKYEDALEFIKQDFRKGGVEQIKALQGLVTLPVTAKLLAKQAAGDLIKGSITEGFTEVGQEMTQYGLSVLGSEKNWYDWEAQDRAANALIGGAVMGGAIAPVFSTPTAVRARRILNSKFVIDPDQPDLSQEEIIASDFVDEFMESSIGDEKIDSLKNRNEIGGMRKNIAAYKEGNKIKNKGVIAWAKDIPKSFLQRGLEAYWKSNQAKTRNDMMESLIAFLSPTNKDTKFGQAIYDKENALNDSSDRSFTDFLNEARGVYKQSNSRAGRRFIDQKIKEIFEKSKASIDGRKYLLNDSETRLLNSLKSKVKKIQDDIQDLGIDFFITAEEFWNLARPSKQKIKADPNKAKRILKEDSTRSYLDGEADKIIDNIINSSANKSQEQSQIVLGLSDVKTRNWNKSKYSAFNAPGMEEFSMTDRITAMKDNARELYRAALVDKYVGNKGDKLMAMLNYAMEDSMASNIEAALAQDPNVNKNDIEFDWDYKYASDIVSAVEIWMGNYNPIQSQRLKEIQANITSFNLTTLLGTGGAAQTPELVAAFMTRISEVEGGKPLLEDLRSAAGDLAKHYATSSSQIFSLVWKGTGLSPTSSWTPQRKRFTAAGRSGIRFGALGQQGFDEQEIKAGRLRAAIGQTFVIVSLIKPATDMARLLSDSVNYDAMMHHLDVLDTLYDPNRPMTIHVKHSYDMLKQAKVPVMRTLKLWQNLKDDLVYNDEFQNADWGDIRSYKKLQTLLTDDSKYGELTKMVNIGVKQMVDNSLANPNPSTKPRVTSDPHYTLLFQFRGYIITFFTSVMPFLVKRALSKNPNADINAINIMVGLVAAGFLAQALKDEFKTGGRPYWLDDAEFIQRGVQSSGMLGPFDFLLDAVNPIYGEASAWNSLEGLMGPTWGSFKTGKKIAGKAIDRDWEGAAEAARKLVPIAGHSEFFRKKPMESIGSIFN